MTTTPSDADVWAQLLADDARTQQARQVLERAADAGRLSDVAAAAEQLRRNPAASMALLSSLEDPRPAQRAAQEAAHTELHAYLTARG